MFKYVPTRSIPAYTSSIRTAVTLRSNLQKEKDQAKKRKLRQELKFNALDNPIDHPLHMPIAKALNILRSLEVGKPADKTTISCNIYVRQEQGAAPIQTKVDIPFPVQRKTKAVVFTTQQPVIEELKKAGIETFGGRDLLDKFLNQELTPDLFTHAFATQEMEPHLKAVARILGPAGLQPTAKKGTVTDDINTILDVIRSFQIKQKDNHISFPVGNCTFSDAQIMSNIKAISDKIYSKIDPNATKKTRLGYCYIGTANSPGLVIDFK
ncbi:mitochondrial ribosomal protein, large subunit, putative [Candida dubliniensis CD36]|uniref:Mitochondrial ribosomal protein, large subunit, putative n=1 Tax=Candida dubliniensis (strain CD36 / ATCC MYA-646 / CBS 7987 / NCPF 3949 / NRRL Y-17841) TaxID=573826 RepID=B9WGV0_CANDC|nr:mitochondrial 54S ribosomal protein MRPL1 [Candida dubliniensis CD36]CAX41388.1 mitochondrial ribosomal protein, large subunit, putative [Candida dubliniensis CD36]